MNEKLLRKASLCMALTMFARVILAQQMATPPSNVPALPADVPGSATRSSVLIMGLLRRAASNVEDAGRKVTHLFPIQ
jgi:hypothetical protein